jgi:hypothetical protein
MQAESGGLFIGTSLLEKVEMGSLSLLATGNKQDTRRFFYLVYEAVSQRESDVHPEIRFFKTVLPESAESAPKRVYGSIHNKGHPSLGCEGWPGQRV